MTPDICDTAWCKIIVLQLQDCRQALPKLFYGWVIRPQHLAHAGFQISIWITNTFVKVDREATVLE
jgi:hypothetical protein